jgi:hypothetical protein
MKHGLIVAMEAMAQNASARLKDFDRGTSPLSTIRSRAATRESMNRITPPSKHPNSESISSTYHLFKSDDVPGPGSSCPRRYHCGPRPPSVRMSAVPTPLPRPPSVRTPVVATPFCGNDRTASSGTSSVMVGGFHVRHDPRSEHDFERRKDVTR